MSKYISIEYDEPNLKFKPSKPHEPIKPDKPSKDKLKDELDRLEREKAKGWRTFVDLFGKVTQRPWDGIERFPGIILTNDIFTDVTDLRLTPDTDYYNRILEEYREWDQKYRDQKYQEYERNMQYYERRMQEYERQMQEWEDFERNPYFFKKKTALIDVENKDFNFLDEVDFDYGVFPQIKIFNQKNRKSLTLTFKDNEQYQKAKSQIIQAIT